MEVYTLSNKGKIKDMIMNFLSPKPEEVEGLNNLSYIYYQNQLLLKLYSIFEIENLPEHWNEEYIKDNLFREGVMFFVEHMEQVYLLNGGYYGINIYNFPTHINIQNVILGYFQREIGIDGELLYFNRVSGGFLSVMPLIKRYALLLAQCDASINVSLMNSRLAHVFITDNTAMAESIKKVYDDVSEGKPFVVVNKGGLEIPTDSAMFTNVKNTYIANDILVTKRTIMNEFLTEIGIMNANTSKRERLNTDEVNANNGETLALCTLWLNTLNSCCEKANKLFQSMGYDLNVHFKFNEKVIDEYRREITTDDQMV